MKSSTVMALWGLFFVAAAIVGKATGYDTYKFDVLVAIIFFVAAKIIEEIEKLGAAQ